MRSVLYPARAGAWMLVLFGEVRNAGSGPEANVDVVAELRDAKGRVVATERAPLGVALGPAELTSLYEAKRPKPDEAVAPGSSAPFTVVMLQPPPQLEALEHDVVLVRVPPPPMVQPAPPPEPASEAEPPAKAKLKGKSKAKAKGKAKGD
jgi:hypothetical protein